MKPKILIVIVPFLDPVFPPLGCAYIKSALRHAGYFVNVIDLNILFLKQIGREREVNINIASKFRFQHPKYKQEYKKGFDDLFKKYDDFINQEINKIIKGDYKYVLFSIQYTQKYAALMLAKKIKEINQNIQIIFGGPQCFKFFYSNIKSLMEKNNFIDYHVYSAEGEKIIIELLDEIENGKEIKTGGVIKRKGDQIIKNPEPELIKDINSIPFPDWDEFDLNLYLKKHALPIISSRGCMNKCVFCSEHKMFKYLRIRTAENVFAEIKQDHKKFGVTHRIFNDSSINNNLKELEKLCDLIINSDINITFEGQANFNMYINKNLLKKMNQAGCVSLNFGLESGSQNVINLMNKSFDIKKSEEIIRNAKKAGIKIMLNFMFGFPGETEENFQETLDYIKRNKDYIDEVHPVDIFTIIIKNTDLANNLEKFNVEYNQDDPFFLWETKDEKNNVLVRLNRFEKFCKLAKKLKIDNFYKSTKHRDRELLIYTDYKRFGLDIKKIPTSMKLLRLLNKHKIH